MDYAFSVRSSSRSKNLSERNRLEIDNILIWEVSSETFRRYMISIQADNSDRVMVSDPSSRESSIIKAYQRNGSNISLCSVAIVMTAQQQIDYNAALEQGNYDVCLNSLITLEESMNRNYGFEKSGKAYRK